MGGMMRMPTLLITGESSGCVEESVLMICLMKRALSSVCVLSALLLTVKADVVLVQTLDSAMVKGEVVMKVKGDKARTDMPAGVMGNMTVLMDAKAGETVTMMHLSLIHI